MWLWSFDRLRMHMHPIRCSELHHGPVQVPVIQILLGQTGLISSQQMLSKWKFVVVGATLAAAVLTPSTDPFTQTLLAVPLIGLYLGGAGFVRLIENQRAAAA